MAEGDGRQVDSVDPRWPRHAGLWASVERCAPAGDIAHDRHHVLRVYRWCLRLAGEADADLDLAGAAGLVHDLALVPKDDPARSAGGERSALLAAEPLAAAGYSAAESAIVLDAVRTSSWSRGLPPANAVAVALQDADRLDAIGAIGIARCFSCAQAMSRPERPGRYYDPADPFAVTGRALDDRRQAVDHFAAKLLLLAQGMRLPTAIAEAQRRHSSMQAFLEELAREIAG